MIGIGQYGIEEGVHVGQLQLVAQRGVDVVRGVHLLQRPGIRHGAFRDALKAARVRAADGMRHPGEDEAAVGQRAGQLALRQDDLLAELRPGGDLHGHVCAVFRARGAREAAHRQRSRLRVIACRARHGGGGGVGKLRAHVGHVLRQNDADLQIRVIRSALAVAREHGGDIRVVFDDVLIGQRAAGLHVVVFGLVRDRRDLHAGVRHSRKAVGRKRLGEEVAVGDLRHRAVPAAQAINRAHDGELLDQIFRVGVSGTVGLPAAAGVVEGVNPDRAVSGPAVVVLHEIVAQRGLALRRAVDRPGSGAERAVVLADVGGSGKVPAGVVVLAAAGVDDILHAVAAVVAEEHHRVAGVFAVLVVLAAADDRDDVAGTQVGLHLRELLVGDAVVGVAAPEEGDAVVSDPAAFKLLRVPDPRDLLGVGAEVGGQADQRQRKLHILVRAGARPEALLLLQDTVGGQLRARHVRLRQRMDAERVIVDVVREGGADGVVPLLRAAVLRRTAERLPWDRRLRPGESGQAEGVVLAVRSLEIIGDGGVPEEFFHLRPSIALLRGNRHGQSREKRRQHSCAEQQR